MNDIQKKECLDLARKVRLHCLNMVYRGKSGHIGSMLSTADVYSVLYTRVLNVSPEQPEKESRDRFILSKGHGGAALLATLAERGFFPMEWLNGYYQDNGKLSGHISHHIPGVEFSTGSLGHGLPGACGMAMAAKQAKKTHRVFCMVSDGDLNEGSSWEAIMLAGQHRWDNLIMLVDYNRLQALGASEDIGTACPETGNVRLESCGSRRSRLRSDRKHSAETAAGIRQTERRHFQNGKRQGSQLHGKRLQVALRRFDR